MRSSIEFPSAVSEIPVADLTIALAYYEEKLGFHVDWGRDGGGLNLDSKEEVDELHGKWQKSGANVLHPPESKPWSRLHEFVAADADNNIIRAFYSY